MQPTALGGGAALYTFADAACHTATILRQEIPFVFRVLRCIQEWHGECFLASMDMNTTILKEVAYQIQSGNPLWGMLIANEYDGLNPLIRKGLTHQFLKRVDTSSALTRHLVEGAVLADLPEHLRAQVGSRISRSSAATPTPRARELSNRRLASRQRSSTASLARQPQLVRRTRVVRQTLQAVL
jgi:hypothetical protein